MSGSIERSVVDGTAVDIDNRNRIVTTVAKVEVDVGLLMRWVGIEATDSIVELRSVVDTGVRCGGVISIKIGIFVGKDKSNIFDGTRGGREIIIRAVEVDRLIVVEEIEIATLSSGHRLGDSLAIIGGGTDVVFNLNIGIAGGEYGIVDNNSIKADSAVVVEGSINDNNGVDDRVEAERVDSGSRQESGELIAIGVQSDSVPIAAVEAIEAFGMCDTRLVGNDG